MKFDIKKHIYLILLFILSFTVETAQSQEVTNIHIAATDTVPTYTSDSAVINFLKDAGIPITQNSKLKLLKSGRAKFIDLFEEIRHAKHHIHLEYFNFRNDSIANALFDLLGEKVKEGVEVRALFDAFGNLSNNKPLKKKHIQAIRDKGIEIVKFDPFKFPYINHALHRDHRKIVVIEKNRIYRWHEHSQLLYKGSAGNRRLARHAYPYRGKCRKRIAGHLPDHVEQKH